MRKKMVDRETLAKWYIDEQLTMTAIDSRLGCSLPLVSKLVRKYGLRVSLEQKYVGKTFGLLEVKERLPGTKYTHPKFLCKCKCGNKTTVVSYALTQGNTTSCGCLLKRRGENNPH